MSNKKLKTLIFPGLGNTYTIPQTAGDLTYSDSATYDSSTVGNELNSLNDKVDRLGTTVYGFHVNSSESDPSEAVTYLRDAVGMTPAYMNYSAGTFNWGSWEDAFFIPRPCMLKTSGEVDYYLDPDDYSKKEDGVTASDVSNTSYDGNAMMEWGQNGKKIWYKIVADATDSTSYSVYIADHKDDDDFVCWSFYNKNNELKDHFYTPIYKGSLISNKLRSLSGQSIINSKTGTQEIAYAQANGSGYNIEVFADKLLMFLLLYLMGKSLDVQTTFGQGHSTGGSSASSLLTTGALNDKGLFFGYNDGTHKVKVFGMEDQWGEQWARTAGLILDTGTYYYKLTEGTADGSTATSYPTTVSTGMLSAGASPTSNGYVSAFAVHDDVILPNAVAGGSSTYYCDYFFQNQSGVPFALLGGASNDGAVCGFYVYLYAGVGAASWNFGAALSCKPLA